MTEEEFKDITKVNEICIQPMMEGNRITIPKGIRKLYGIKVGDMIKFKIIGFSKRNHHGKGRGEKK